MMRLLLFAVVLVNMFVAGPAFAAETTVVKTMAGLRKLGIELEHLRNDTPGASIQIGSLVDVQKCPGAYAGTECVVLNVVVEPDKLARADAGALEGVTVVRRSESSKERSIFLVLGKDLSKTHLAFQFEVRDGETTKTVRYLFPVRPVVAGKG